jgi:hypothetical protein
MVKRFSIRAAIVAFVTVLVGSIVSIALASILSSPPLARFTPAVAVARVFIAPYLAMEFILERVGVLSLFQSFIAMVLVSSVVWGCIVGIVWPVFRRHRASTI